MVFLLIFLSIILHCCAEKILKNDFIAITNINVGVFSGTWRHIWLREGTIAELCQSLRSLPIVKLSTQVKCKDPPFVNLDSVFKTFSKEIVTHNTPELNYGLFLSENWKSDELQERHSYISYKNENKIPAILCSWEKSKVYVVESDTYPQGYFLFWKNKYFGLQFLGHTLQIHNMNVIEENPVPLKDYSSLWESFTHEVDSEIIESYLPYKYLIWELCASTLVTFMEEKMKYMNVESSLQPKNLILPCPKKKYFFLIQN